MRKANIKAMHIVAACAKISHNLLCRELFIF